MSPTKELTVMELPVNTNSPIRWGIGVLIIGFGIFILWAAFAPLDEGVPTQAAVAIDTKRKLIQHLTGGLVSEIRVKEGQLVKAGDILLTLDNKDAKAKYEEISQKYIADRALEDRLIAEQLGAKTIKFHPDLQNRHDDQLVQQQMSNQVMLLHSRSGSLTAELEAMQEQVQGFESQIRGATGVLQARQDQLTLLTQQLSGVRDLVAEGFAPRTQQSDLELRVAQIKGDITDTQFTIMRAKHSISELKQRILLRKADYQKEVDTQMGQVRSEVGALSDKLNFLSNELSRTEIRSPVDGQVINLQFQTVGAVIQPSQKILEVVPLSEGLLLEAKVSPQFIDRIHTGQEADIRFVNFANSPQLMVEGRVDSISKDLLTEPSMNPSQPGATYYLARISVTTKGLKALKGRIMQPGMPVQVIIKTGERSLLTYLLHPFTKRMAASLKEE